MRNSRWLRLLAYVTGSVNQELLLRNEYLAAENRILRTKLPARLRLPKPERITLAEIGKRLGRRALREVACVAKPDTILDWYRKLIPKSSTGPNIDSTQGGPLYRPRWKLLSCGWRGKTRVGVTTASSERCPTWAITSPIRR